MYISNIDVNNFRLLKETRINCEKDLSLIIGKNNCGKTSLLSILNKCIGTKAEIGNFEYYDFSISFQNKLYNVVLGKDEFEAGDLKGIQTDIFIEYNNTDDLSNISSLFLDLDPDNKTVVLRFSYILKDVIEDLKTDFDTYKKARKELDEKDAFVKFMSKNHKKYFEFKRYSVLYDYSSKKVDNSTYKFLDNKDIDISKIIAFNYVDAKRNVSNAEDAELSSLAGRYYEKSKDPEGKDITSTKIDDALDKTDGEFNKLYIDIFKPLTDKISKFGGMKKDDTTMKVISQIKAMNLLKNNTTVVYDDQTCFLPENYNGLGFLNLFSIIMNIEIKLCDFRKESKKDETPADINLLFIEEPEAHTHPQMQYVFIKNIKNLLDEGRKIGKSERKINLQTFMTTHSSHIVAECNFDDIKYFVKKDDEHNVESKNLKDLKILYQKEKGVENNHFKFLKQYLTLNRAEIFFADKIILIEGDTERILLPAMIKKLDQENEYEAPLSSQNISIIEVGNYSEIYAEFIQFIGTKTLIITDIDTERYQDVCGKDGKPQKDSKGNIKQSLKACRVSDGTHTSNSSIKYYLKHKLGTDLSKAKDILTNLTLNDKTIYGIINKNKVSWQSKKDGNVLIVYQTKETNKDGEEYNARSFEDAFFHLNRTLFTERGGTNDDENIEQCKLDFQGIKNVEEIFKASTDSYDLADMCVKKKPSLAMDILLNSESDESKDFINWMTPEYIKEGLEWLQKN